MNKQIEDEGLTCAYLLGKSDGYQQGRADAIDECIEALGNNFWDIAKLEKLKEQNNG